MSWICVGCSLQESDDNEVRGFGLCKTCQLKAKKAKAKLALAMKAKHAKRKKW